MQIFSFYHTDSGPNISTVRPIKLWTRKTTFNHVTFMCVFEVIEKQKVLPLHCIALHYWTT